MPLWSTLWRFSVKRRYNTTILQYLKAYWEGLLCIFWHFDITQIVCSSKCLPNRADIHLDTWPFKACESHQLWRNVQCCHFSYNVFKRHGSFYCIFRSTVWVTSSSQALQWSQRAWRKDIAVALDSSGEEPSAAVVSSWHYVCEWSG